MISHILVPMDDSEMSVKALEYALENHPDAEITVLHVVGVPSAFMGEAASLAIDDDLEEVAEGRAGPIFERARELAVEYDATLETEFALGQPGRAIVRRAEEFDAVVIGSHGRHSDDVLRRYLVGNVAKTVFNRSPVPVTVVR